MIDWTASVPHLVLAAGLLFFLSVLANRLSDRLAVPTLLLFLAVGMLAGSDGIGGIQFDNPSIANLVGVIALAYILFAGGLDTNWPTVRPVLWQGVVLSTLGVAVTAALVGLFAWKVLSYSLKEGLLLGSIVSSTDAAAVFSVLRSRGVRLKGRLKPLLELESASNDPMAVLLTVTMISIIAIPAAPWMNRLLSLIGHLVIGLAAGAAIGFLTAFLFNRLRLEYEGLYPVLGMSVVLLTYSLTEVLYGNGFLAVYACGVVLGNRDFLYKRTLSKFHDGLSWLMQIILFLSLGLLVFPSQLPRVAGPAILVSAFLMLAARPAAVYLCLWRSPFSIPERTLIAWTGLRGAVPIVLATFPFMSGYEHSDLMFDVVFFIVLTSALFQGKTLMAAARILKVDAPLIFRPKYPIEFEKRRGLQGETREIDIPADAFAAGKRISDLGLPSDVLILLVRRGDAFIIPRGDTGIEAFDTLMMIAGRDSLSEARKILLAAQQPADS